MPTDSLEGKELMSFSLSDEVNGYGGSQSGIVNQCLFPSWVSRLI